MKTSLVETKGHWFCHKCDDIVFMTYEQRTAGKVPCPVCGDFTCEFIPHRLGRAQIAASWFEAMRLAVDQATNPELPDMRPSWQMERPVRK